MRLPIIRVISGLKLSHFYGLAGLVVARFVAELVATGSCLIFWFWLVDKEFEQLVGCGV